MFPLIETIIGFAAIMLTLSFLVKSLTSVVKIHLGLDKYYGNRLKEEAASFFGSFVSDKPDEPTDKPKIDKTQLEEKLLAKVTWSKMGEDFFDLDNVKFWLGEFSAETKKYVDGAEKEILARLKVHREIVKHAFTKQNKKAAVFVGLALCLLLNINALTIWNTLYANEGLRSKFASEDYAKGVSKRYEEARAELEKIEAKLRQNPSGGEGESGNADTDLPAQKEAAKASLEIVKEEYETLQSDLSFGIGRIWTGDRRLPWAPDDKEKEQTKWVFIWYELLGSLLTGLMISIGAPYWHDLLRAMANLRKLAPKPNPGGQSNA